MIFVLFYIWEDARVWANWNYSFDKHLNYLGPISCFSPSWLPLRVHCQGSLWWPMAWWWATFLVYRNVRQHSLLVNKGRQQFFVHTWSLQLGHKIERKVLPLGCRIVFPMSLALLMSQEWMATMYEVSDCLHESVYSQLLDWAPSSPLNFFFLN